MGKRFHAQETEEETKVDISPLIDCVFILLIFFIVTTTFVNEKGVAASVPEPAPPTPPTEEEPTTLVFRVNDKNQVIYDGRVISLNAVQPLVRASKLGEDTPVIVQAVGDVVFGPQIRVIDEVRQAGVKPALITMDYRNTQ